MSDHGRGSKAMGADEQTGEDADGVVAISEGEFVLNRLIGAGRRPKRGSRSNHPAYNLVCVDAACVWKPLHGNDAFPCCDGGNRQGICHVTTRYRGRRYMAAWHP